MATNRSMTRPQWIAARRHTREANPTRFARGLSGQHAIGGWIVCPGCAGTGTAPDPFRFRDAPDYVGRCPVCSGHNDGRVWDYFRDEDPLLAVARKRHAGLGVRTWGTVDYERVRLIAARPIAARLRQCDMAAMATRCVTQMQQLRARAAA